MNGMHLFLFDVKNMIFGPYLAATHRIHISVMAHLVALTLNPKQLAMANRQNLNPIKVHLKPMAGKGETRTAVRMRQTVLHATGFDCSIQEVTACRMLTAALLLQAAPLRQES
jgi:hypothetical protein